MAANSKGRVLAGSFGKRLVNQIWAAGSRDPPPFPYSTASASRRGVHVSTYDKNVDDQVRPSNVPDDVIAAQSDKYWGPHPKTGVFGPADQNSAPGGDPTAPAGNGPSVLDQKAWFRPLEDVDKPPHT
ncbi:late embryogenesis abundant protein At5g17165 [Elaeis guineensis]|uniref:Late embryogenesis abundant protein At5g17165 n=1 Tax=Elaeis guineensis var. tenera TaxID=51953 RepID=A0A6I9R3Y7_ELAGV|nr:late embryogenesis abundant protein At5g17165 [Elaeis guineensis]